MFHFLYLSFFFRVLSGDLGAVSRSCFVSRVSGFELQPRYGERFVQRTYGIARFRACAGEESARIRESSNPFAHVEGVAYEGLRLLFLIRSLSSY